MEVFLYKLEECAACAKAKQLLESQGHTVQEIMIDNPLLEMGIQMLFNDKQVHAPIAVIPNKGIYILNTEADQMFRLVSLEPEEALLNER